MNKNTKERLEALENRVRVLEGQVATCMRALRYVEEVEEEDEEKDEIESLASAIHTLEAKVVTIQSGFLGIVEPKAAAVDPTITKKETPSA